MRYLSKVFQPVITIPKNAKIKNTEITCKSQKLLLECGLVRPTSSGLFALMPLARRALHKLERLCRQAVEEAGAQEISLPALTSASLWEASGRLNTVGDLLKVNDRHGKEFLLAPTHEESIADLLADVGPLSYKQLPLILYQVSNKYRDEYRPKHGLLRAREFLMLDAYGAHADDACARDSYHRVGHHFEQLFARLQLPVYRVSAECGDMGGALSHEWQLAAGVGEDAVAVCAACSHAQRAAAAAAAPGARCAACGGEARALRTVEVGHTFVLGARYAAALRAECATRAGARAALHMTCYGLGLTRLLAAALEAQSDERRLRWPEPIAPYHTLVVPPKEGSREGAACGEGALRRVVAAVTAPERLRDALVDDRLALTVGRRVLQAERMGYPCVVVAGRGLLDSPPRVEVRRRDAEPQLLTLEQLERLARAEEMPPLPPRTLDNNIPS